MSAIARKESKRRASVRVGLIGLAVAVLLASFAVTAKNGLPDYLPGESRNAVKVSFSDVGALREGDDVRISDVRAGFVSAVELDKGTPVVTLQLNDGRKVYQDASAVIAARSGLGQKYVELNPGSPSKGELGADQVISVKRTMSPTELDDVLGALDPTTRAAGTSTLRQVGGGAAGHGDDVNAGLAKAKDILPDLAKLSNALSADNGADLEQMLQTADVVSRSLQAQGDQIRETTKQTSKTLKAIAADGGEPLSHTINEAAATMEKVRPALDQLNGPLADAESAVRAFQPGAKALSAAMPDLRGFLRESPQVLDEVPAFADVAKPAVERLIPTMKDLQPLSQQLATAFGRGKSPLSVMAPYSSEILLFFQNASSALSQGDGAGRWLRFYPILTPQSLTGILPVRDPSVSRQAYPAPGEARTHRQGSIYGEGFH